LASLIGALVLNAAANLWMIPRWGATGAATATLLSEAVLVALGAILVAWRFGILPALRPAMGGLAATAVGYAVLRLSSGGLLGTAAALAGYIAPLLLLRIVTAEDGLLVLGWIREIAPRAARS